MGQGVGSSAYQLSELQPAHLLNAVPRETTVNIYLVKSCQDGQLSKSKNK